MAHRTSNRRVWQEYENRLQLRRNAEQFALNFNFNSARRGHLEELIMSNVQMRADQFDAARNNARNVFREAAEIGAFMQSVPRAPTGGLPALADMPRAPTGGLPALGEAHRNRVRIPLLE